jgi:hypothetical protein
MKTMLTLKLDGMPGDTVQATATEMLRIADLLGVMVVVPFNETRLTMRPGGDPDKLVREFMDHKCNPWGNPYRSAWG